MIRKRPPHFFPTTTTTIHTHTRRLSRGPLFIASPPPYSRLPRQRKVLGAALPHVNAHDDSARWRAGTACELATPQSLTPQTSSCVSRTAKRKERGNAHKRNSHLSRAFAFIFPISFPTSPSRRQHSLGRASTQRPKTPSTARFTEIQPGGHRNQRFISWRELTKL